MKFGGRQAKVTGMFREDSRTFMTLPLVTSISVVVVLICLISWVRFMWIIFKENKEHAIMYLLLMSGYVKFKFDLQDLCTKYCFLVSSYLL
jgi:hypothetical protein